MLSRTVYHGTREVVLRYSHHTVKYYDFDSRSLVITGHVSLCFTNQDLSLSLDRLRYETLESVDVLTVIFV